MGRTVEPPDRACIVCGGRGRVNGLGGYDWPASHVAGVLKNDGTGILTWGPVGTLIGSGTVNKHSKWVTATTLGDGLIFDNGTTLSINSNSTNASAILDLNVTDQGLLLPRIALTGNNDVASVAGAEVTSLLIYNTATVVGANAVKPGFYFWNGTIWIAIASVLPPPENLGPDGTILLWDAATGTYANSPVSTTGTTTTINENLSTNNNNINTGTGDLTTDAITSTSIVTTVSRQTSDLRFKKNVNTVEGALSKVLEMRGVTYEWKREDFPEKNFREGRIYGVIAQEVEKIAPELVQTGEDGYKSVEYANMVSLFIEAIKEQQKTINSQKSDISVLKASVENEKSLRNEQVNSLISRIESLEKNVESNTNKAEK